MNVQGFDDAAANNCFFHNMAVTSLSALVLASACFPCMVLQDPNQTHSQECMDVKGFEDAAD
jgi:hypothetical protein